MTRLFERSPPIYTVKAPLKVTTTDERLENPLCILCSHNKNAKNAFSRFIAGTRAIAGLAAYKGYGMWQSPVEEAYIATDVVLQSEESP